MNSTFFWAFCYLSESITSFLACSVAHFGQWTVFQVNIPLSLHFTGQVLLQFLQIIDLTVLRFGNDWKWDASIYSTPSPSHILQITVPVPSQWGHFAPMAASMASVTNLVRSLSRRFFASSFQRFNCSWVTRICRHLVLAIGIILHRNEEVFQGSEAVPC